MILARMHLANGIADLIDRRMHMFSSIGKLPIRSNWQMPLLVAFLAILAGVATARFATAAELLMLERPGCPWCKRFNDEIAPGYAKSEEGRRAPLRRVDITRPWPADLAAIAQERLTPTFVLVENGLEIGRLRGYPGDEFFWVLLDDMLAKLPETPTSGASATQGQVR